MEILSSTVQQLRAALPGPVTPQWPQGERFVRAFAHGSMSVELYAPQGHDPQTPHRQDELYVVVSGSGQLVLDGRPQPVAAGSVVFVPAGAPHRFEAFSDDFATWVVFWGPDGGERDLARPDADAAGAAQGRSAD